MSIASELEQMAANKAAIKAAIEAKNPSTMPGLDMSQWADAIASIQSGGGATGYTLTVEPYSYPVPAILSDGTQVTVAPNSTQADVIAIQANTNNAGQIRINNIWVGSTGEVDQQWFYLTQDSTVYMTNSDICVLKGTKIMLSDHTEKNVEDITYDDDLLVWNFDEGKLDSAKPIWIKGRQCTRYYFINKYKSGKILKSTGDSETGFGHRVFNTRRNLFMYTTETVGSEVFTLDGPDLTISSEYVEEDCEFYNIVTRQHINCFANRILTSCSLNNYLYPMRNMKFVKSERKLKDISEFDGFIPKDYVEGLRLLESTRSVEDLVSYVDNMIRHEKVAKGEL